MGTVSRILTPADATSLQTALNAHGAHLEVDGHFGELSHLALIRFQHDNGLPETGNPDLVTTSALGIPAITTPAPAPPPKLTPNPVVQAIGLFALNTILNQVLKGTGINMDFAKVSKAIAAGLSGAGLLGGHSVYGYISLPPDQMAALPGWVPATVVTVNAVVGFGIAFAVTYFAPANKTA